MHLKGYTQYYLAGVTYEDFINFLFDHEVIPIHENSMNDDHPWYWKAEVHCNPIEIINHYIKLFNAPQFLITRFSNDQLEQGFWAIQSGNIECAVSEIIWEKEIPKEIRKKCVRSMYHLYEKIFSSNKFYTSVNMWWDSLAYDWHCENRCRFNGGEDAWMQDIMFETLKQILFLPNIECQLAALHGLGHLQHPDTEQVIKLYLKNNIDLDDKVYEYALAASKFEVM